MNTDDYYYAKYMKYKIKYTTLRNTYGGKQKSNTPLLPNNLIVKSAKAMLNSHNQPMLKKMSKTLTDIGMTQLKKLFTKENIMILLKENKETIEIIISVINELSDNIEELSKIKEQICKKLNN